MVLFNKCCCCIQLRTGAIILGVLTLIVSIINVVTGFTNYSYFFSDDSFTNGWTEAELAILDILRVWYIWSIAMGILMIIACVLMLFGAIKGRHKFLIPYLAIEIIRTIVAFIYLIYTMTLLSEQLNTSVQVGTAAIVGGVIGLVLSIYLWLCVFSLFQFYRDESKRPGFIGGTPYAPTHGAQHPQHQQAVSYQ